MKAKDDSLKVVEDFTVDSGKTRDMAGIMKAIVDQNRVVLIFRDGDDATKRAARNIPWLRCMAYNRLLAHDLYYAETVVVTESAAAALVDQLSDKKREVANAE
jgi:large subunit ribosomal protein L4